MALTQPCELLIVTTITHDLSRLWGEARVRWAEFVRGRRVGRPPHALTCVANRAARDLWLPAAGDVLSMRSSFVDLVQAAVS